MERLKQAALLAGLDPEKVDFPLLVGGFARLATWHSSEPHLDALAKKSICTEFREHGQEIINRELES